MKVISWGRYNDTDNRVIENSGGYFDDGMRWKDYICNWDDEAIPYIEALRQEILDKGIRYTGEQHQYADDGMPIFEDQTVATFTFRAWGDLMAAIWSEAENKDYSYMDFYC